MNEAFPWRDLAAEQQVDLSPDYDTAEIREILEVWVAAAERLTTLDDQAVAWALIQKIKQSAAIIESVLAPKMHEQIPRSPGWIDTPVGVFKRSFKGRKWTWDIEPALEAVVAHAKENRRFSSSTGEVEGEAEAVFRCLLQAAQVGYCRKTALKAMDIDPDKYATKEEGTPWVAPA